MAKPPRQSPPPAADIHADDKPGAHRGADRDPAVGEPNERIERQNREEAHEAEGLAETDPRRVPAKKKPS